MEPSSSYKRLADRGGDLVLQAQARLIAKIAGLDRPGAAEAFDDGGIEEVLGEVAGQGRRHQHDAQVFAQHGLRIEREGEAFVRIERAFVEFVEQDGADAFQRGVGQDHAAEHAFGDDFDARVLRCPHIEAGAQADRLADLLAEGRRHALGGGARCDAARLDQDELAPAVQASSSRASGTRVVLPAPGGAEITRRDLSRSSARICGITSSIGRSDLGDMQRGRYQPKARWSISTLAPITIRISPPTISAWEPSAFAPARPIMTPASRKHECDEADHGDADERWAHPASAA